jgi:hypothetical protein
MSTVKSPQEKKKLSLEHDRRNTYGENAKSSRKNIPKSKQRSHQNVRRAANAPLRALQGEAVEELADLAEGDSRAAVIGKKRESFRKLPDRPVGAVLAKKKSSKRTTLKAYGA